MKKCVWLFMVILGFFLLIRGFLPVPQAIEENCLRVEGVVLAVEEAGEKDILITLKGRTQKYYINRGLEKGFTLAGIRQTLQGQQVKIKYPDYWSWLGHSMKHLSKLEMGEKVIYSELE